MCKLLVLAGALCLATSIHAGSDGSDFGHGFQIIAKVVRQFLKSQPEDLTLGEGVHIVSTGSINDADARSVGDDNTILGAMDNYLQTHEVRIKLPELMPGEGFGRAFKDAMVGFDGNETGKKMYKYLKVPFINVIF